MNKQVNLFDIYLRDFEVLMLGKNIFHHRMIQKV